MKPITSCILLLLFITSLRLGANVLVTGVNVSGTGTGNAYSANASNSDLVNTGASSLASTTFSAAPHFGPTAHNDGAVGGASTTADITFWLNALVDNTYSITYTLDLTTNTLGYDINSIQTINGWTGNSSGTQKNQTYQVFVSAVGSPSFTLLATVAYSPFTTANNTASSMVNITQGTTGILASGIDEIRFTYTVAQGGTHPSPTIREIDVFGSAVPLGPDLTEPTIATLSPLDNAGAVSLDSNLVITFNENIAIGSGDITIKNLDAPSQIAIPVGDSQISVSGNVMTINPSTDLTPNTNYAIQIAATAIDDMAGNSFPGITNDTTWNFTTGNIVTIPLAVTSPVIRQVVQRNGGNLGSIPVAGTAAADRVEARAVAGGANGVTTLWQTIATNPNGAFSGTLTGVTAGGWYSVEVRTITAETTVQSSTINQVGVGDIYVTAGQSNSANFGSPGMTPTDNRVVARSSVSANTWVAAADPMPIAGGTGGSIWSRLGELLAADENIPIGFIAMGVGSTQVSQWIPGTSNYDSRLKPALQSLPLNGFRAVLWHQGESDSIAGVSAATHASRLNSMISQSRTDAGWNVPWYLAEASFHPNTSLVAEERIAAGQRAVVNTDPLTFLGPSTDEFHLEDASGGKLADSVHFNATGLLDHATQWRDILRGTTVITPRNSGFEDNRTPAITNLAPLADGAAHIATISGNNDSPMVLDWRILAASGVEAADGSNGFHNPTTGTYAGAVDTANGGVLPNMVGRHVAMLDGGSAGNTFLQSTRVAAKPNTNYTFTVALGVRDNPATFGNARLEITANGTVVSSATFTKAALDTLRGGDASGTFTNASVSWITGGSVAANQLLAIRVIKTGGAATVLDFDNIRFTDLPNIYTTWINGFNLNPSDKDFNDDPDGDGLANGLESWFGTNPGQFNAGVASLTTNGSITTFTHPMNVNPGTDISGSYQWSQNLVTWYPSGGGPGGGLSVTFVPVTIGTTTTVTATASEPLEKLFLRVGVSQN